MIVCRKTGEMMSAWKWMARICSKIPLDENMESSCVLLVEKTAVSEGICGKGRDQSEKGDF